ARELLFIEARSGMADVNQGRGTGGWGFVDAEQQRAEVRARLTRLGPAGDHELLLVDDLDFPPVGRALAGLVQRVGVLGDQAFPAPLERFLVKRAAVAADLAADAEDRRRRAAEDALQRGATLVQRAIAIVGGALAQDIEHDQPDRRACTGVGSLFHGREMATPVRNTLPPP